MSEHVSQEEAVLAVDLGGTRLRVAVFDGSGSILLRSVIPTPLGDPGALAKAMRQAASESPLPVRCAVVGVAGPISYRDGEAVNLPNLPGWAPYVSARRLEAETGLDVMLANDADLAALGEHRFGAGRGVSDLVYMTSSTGVGAGVVIGGRLLHGRWSLAEAGHMIIDRRTRETVEDLGSGKAIERLSGLRGEVVTARAQSGDAEALRVIRDVAEVLGIAVHNLVHCFMPERVVIGGGVSQAGEFLLAPLRAELDGCDKGCSIRGDGVVLAESGDDAGLLGAYAFWQDTRADSR